MSFLFNALTSNLWARRFSLLSTAYIFYTSKSNAGRSEMGIRTRDWSGGEEF